MLKLFDLSTIIMYLLSIKNNKSILKTKKKNEKSNFWNSIGTWCYFHIL